MAGILFSKISFDKQNSCRKLPIVAKRLGRRNSMCEAAPAVAFFTGAIYSYNAFKASWFVNESKGQWQIVDKELVECFLIASPVLVALSFANTNNIEYFVGVLIGMGTFLVIPRSRVPKTM